MAGLDPELWEATQNPWVILRTVSRDKIKAALAQPEFRQRLDDLLRQNRESYQRGRMVSEEAPGCRAHLGRLFQHGVHAERSVADLLGRTRQCRRRPDESGKRSGRTRGRCRFALRPRILSPGFRFGRTAARTLPGQRSGPVAHPAAAASRMGSGSGFRFNCPARRSGCVAGKCLLEERSFICSTPMISPIPQLIAVSLASSMAATLRCG